MTQRHHNIPAAYLVLLKENKILLLRRFNTGYRDGQYSFIAGHVDPGETFTQCIIREAQEEAGIILEEKDMEVAHVMHRNSEPNETSERVDIFFTTQNWEGEITNKEPHKCDELAWFEMDDLPNNIIPYIKQVIDEIKSKRHYSEYGWE